MKKRYKALIGFVIAGIILISIFFITRDKKIYYLSLGDYLASGKTFNKTVNKSYGDYVKEYLSDKEVLEFYTKDFTNNNYRSIDLLNDINNNKEININGKKITIKNALIKADLVTVSIGMNDLFYKLNIQTGLDLNEYGDIYSYIDEVMYDIDKLLYVLRKSCKEEIMVLGFYNPFTNYSSNLSLSIEPIIEYSNGKMKNLVNKYDMTYIDIHDSFLANDDYLPNTLEINPTNKGYRAVSDKIISLIDKKILAK